MSSKAVQEIVSPISKLEPYEFEELSAWLDQQEQPFDVRIKADLEAGRLNDLINSALEQERLGLTMPLEEVLTPRA